MASSPPPAAKPSDPLPSDAPTKPAPPPPKRNPAFKMMGLPNWRLKLPSRNWLIFLSITGSFTSALLYDRHQKKLAQRKWCALVEHLASEPLPVNRLQRKLTVYLSAPPGDGLRSAREYFQEYVKPVLVAAALDWEVVEGRREGEVRAGLADRIRRLRRKRGETGPGSLEGEAEALQDVQAAVEETRQKAGVAEWEGVKGDIVIGRHTWKEYIRGLHEGWLGPLDPPLPPPPENAVQPSDPETTPSDSLTHPDSLSSQTEPQSAETDPASHTEPQSAEATPSTPEEVPAEDDSKAEKPKPTGPTPPYIPTTTYPSSALPSSIPATFEPSTPLPLPHILGFLNTPIRIYRFLNRRHLADRVGRETAAAVLASQTRPYAEASTFASSIEPESGHGSPASVAPAYGAGAGLERGENDGEGGGAVVQTGARYEQEGLLAEEEGEWHKSVRKRKDDEGERVWLEPVVLDARIAARMRRFDLAPSDEGRARELADESGNAGWSALQKVLESLGVAKARSDGKPGWLQGEEGDVDA